ncbi:retrovirus-related pol polyprotein from transposon tnt 1-94 [Trifolium medium]|uniref:Retrovirus-related pol polyprotein from transposon tnt 1-94 n=1 Tax=Trifolium medium TaxID=97028 RepID=A0A392PB15_9FABA|nr:retrovirus-related pol polyprotein from transposon tnt 1-94 [Trifolium medium]
MNWATYVMNRCPIFAVKDMTPEEAWSGVKPSVHHFRVFGCLAHSHVPNVHRKKLDGRSIKCVLLGVSEESKAYKLYDHVERKIIVSRDVMFEENKGWNWNKKKADKVNEIVSDTEDNNDVEVENEQAETGTNTIDEIEDNDANGETNLNQESSEELDDDIDESNEITPREIEDHQDISETM